MSVGESKPPPTQHSERIYHTGTYNVAVQLTGIIDVSRLDSGLLSMMLQLLDESLHCVGMLQLCCPARLRPSSDCRCSFSLVYHVSTLISQAVSIFLSHFLSFFVSQIPPV